MTAAADIPKPSYQQFAETLATELAGYHEEKGLGDNSFQQLLTPATDALVSDAFGLLQGIAEGTITQSQPRIRDDILQVIERIPSDADLETSKRFSRFLNTVLSRAAMAGLTADNQTLTAFRQQGRPR